ncbi:DEAD/DEAH box helicase [Candidatus Woesearchaeota archaeon]|nr:DEAD/DEAH box helicase [Candidatus Woesearchaeota archaeon]
MMEFSELKLEDDLIRVAVESGFKEPTAIQAKAIPLIKSGSDLIGQSETGSGKTVAFVLPILEKIARGGGVQCLVLTPTRELAEQVASEFSRFGKYRHATISAVYGGVEINPQINRIRHSEIVVATPGRLLDHLSRRTVDLSRVKFLILDEADKMFDMGFIGDVKEIISHTPRNRQTLLFSATISHDVMELSRSYMNSPASVKSSHLVDKKFLKQEYYDSSPRDKFSLLLHLIKQENPGLGMVFCATRTRTDSVARNLHKNNVEAIALHGGHSQNRRNAIIRDFHSGKIHILVATDVAARGLDIKNVTHVFNFDIPKTSQEYVHRIGRTARAGKSGKAISILCDIDHDNFRRVLDDRTLVIEKMPPQSFARVPFIARQHDAGDRKFGNRPRPGGGRFHPMPSHPRRSPGNRSGYGSSYGHRRQHSSPGLRQ